MMQLSENFTLEEFIASDTATRRGIDNRPPPAILRAVLDTAHRMEKVRALLSALKGKPVPIIINSGYRCAALNRAVRGSKNSAHMRGRAVDFTAPSFGTPLQVARAIAAEQIQFDQLINEFGGWVHIGFDQSMRGQLLTYYRADGEVRTAQGLRAA